MFCEPASAAPVAGFLRARARRGTSAERSSSPSSPTRPQGPQAAIDAAANWGPLVPDDAGALEAALRQSVTVLALCPPRTGASSDAIGIAPDRSHGPRRPGGQGLRILRLSGEGAIGPPDATNRVIQAAHKATQESGRDRPSRCGAVDPQLIPLKRGLARPRPPRWPAPCSRTRCSTAIGQTRCCARWWAAGGSTGQCTGPAGWRPARSARSAASVVPDRDLRSAAGGAHIPDQELATSAARAVPQAGAAVGRRPQLRARRCWWPRSAKAGELLSEAMDDRSAPARPRGLLARGALRHPEGRRAGAALPAGTTVCAPGYRVGGTWRAR